MPVNALANICLNIHLKQANMSIDMPRGGTGLNIYNISRKLFFTCNDYTMTLDSQTKVGSLIDKPLCIFLYEGCYI